MSKTIAAFLLAIAPCAAQDSKPKPAPIPLTEERLDQLKLIAFEAARDGDVKTLQEYFKVGRPVNELNARGDTLLTVAAYAGNAEAVGVILKQPKIEVDAKNKMGLTALTAAAFKGHTDVGRQLVGAGANVNFANDSGQTALMFAAMSGRTKMVEFLLENKADAKAADKKGNTARKLAEVQGATDVLKLLDGAK